MHIFFDAEKLKAHVPVCEKMNIRQTLEPYVPDPPSRKAKFSPILNRSRSRSSLQETWKARDRGA